MISQSFNPTHSGSAGFPSSNSTGDEPSGFSAHHALLGADQLIIENLRGLDQVPKEFTLCAFPFALANADGAPVRAVAII